MATESTEHKMSLLKTKVGSRILFSGVCSCGDSSPPRLTTAGMVHSWHADHINRFPHLTKALVIASATASSLGKNGSLLLAGATLRDAAVLADELERQTKFARREAEQIALDLYRQACEDVEEARSAHRASPR